MTGSIPKPTPANRSAEYDAKLDAVLRAGARVMAQEGYGNATIRQVAREAGMSLAGLYHYFSSKEELLFLIQYHSFGAILDGLEERLAPLDDSRRRLEVMVTNHLEHFLARIDDLTVCAREMESLSGHYFAQVEEQRRRYFSITLKIVEAVRAEAGGSGAEPRLATLYLFGMLNWIYMWYPAAEDCSADTLAEPLITLFLDGFLPRGSRRRDDRATAKTSGALGLAGGSGAEPGDGCAEGLLADHERDRTIFTRARGSGGDTMNEAHHDQAADRVASDDDSSRREKSS